MSGDYIYEEITVIDPDTFTCTVTAAGPTSGTEGAYVPVAKATSVTDDTATISSPNSGNIQIISMKLITGTKSGSTFTLTMPSSISNGAGTNDSKTSQNPPQVACWNLSNGSFNPSATLLINTSSNFNQFQVGAISQLVDNLLKFTF